MRAARCDVSVFALCVAAANHTLTSPFSSLMWTDDGFEVPTMSDLLADPELGALDESIEMHVALGGLLSDDEDDLF